MYILFSGFTASIHGNTAQAYIIEQCTTNKSHAIS